MQVVFLFSSSKYLEVEFLAGMIILFLICWGTSILFPIGTALIYIPTNSTQGLPCLHILSNTYYFFLVDINHSDRCELTPDCDFVLHFPDP